MTWKKHTLNGLSEKLRAIALELRSLAPKVVETQAEALKNMAETVVASQGLVVDGRNLEPNDQAPAPDNPTEGRE